ncbi:MAG: hypothetical protein RMK52_06330 [Chitinophagales bacterium]|nr:hypothetical protein [Chitinophagales bacterium]MDW8393843.1 hypothetical protein [Chitinophagales bacterium]
MKYAIPTHGFRSVLLLCTFSLLLNSLSSFGQPRLYWTADWESIFSMGKVDAGAQSLKAVVRYAPFFNYTHQMNVDFSPLLGMYTGLGIRNVGLISHYTDDQNQLTKIKERSYALGMPLAFRIGELPDGASFAVGALGELMFAYKRKIFTPQGEKRKIYNWFDDRVNLLNASLLAELRFPKGSYIRFNYYLRDFLNYRGIDESEGVNLPDYGLSSPLFSLSIGVIDDYWNLDIDELESDKPRRTSSAQKSPKANDRQARHSRPAR